MARRRRTAGRPPPAPDGGFTLPEVVVSLAIVGIVMAPLMAFFVDAVRLARYERGREAAVEVSTSALDRVRALNGGVLAGRYSGPVDNQWQHAATEVRASLDEMDPAYDTPVVGRSATAAALPTDPSGEPNPANGVSYLQHWYVGWCWQQESARCTNAVRTGVRYARVVVAVTWSDERCPASACTYVTSTLVTGVLTDPMFAVRSTT